jgi:hypothetical protein
MKPLNKSWKHLGSLVAASLLLGACSTLQPATAPAPLPIIQALPAPPRPMVMLNLEWHVFVDENGDAWVALKTKGYQSLILNFAEIERYIKQMELNDEYLRNRIEGSETQDPQT